MEMVHWVKPLQSKPEDSLCLSFSIVKTTAWATILDAGVQ